MTPQDRAGQDYNGTMAEDSWVVIRKAEAAEAREIGRLLERERIPVRCRPDATGHRYLWFAWWARSRPVEVAVPEADAERARTVVEEFKTLSRREK